jgi:hypothetical protein
MRKTLRLLLPAVVASLALGFAAGPALAAPENDDFANAQALSGNRGTAPFDLTDATNQVSEPLVGEATDRTAWFRYEPSQNGIASFSTCRLETDLVMDGGSIAVYSGGTLATLASDGESTGGCRNGRVNAVLSSLAVLAGHTYWVQLEVSATSATTGGTLIYDFNTAAPSNDDMADAQTIAPTLPQTVDADNGLATTEDAEPNIQDWGPRNSLWFTWTPGQDGTVSVDTCSTVWSDSNLAADSRLDIFTDSDPDPEVFSPTSVASNDDGCGAPNSLLSHAFTEVTSGTTYFIRVANYADDYGYPYKLKLRWVGDPETSSSPFIYPNGARLQVGETYNAWAAPWIADPAITETSVQWKLCDADGTGCDDIDGATDWTYVPQPSEIGHRLVVSSIGTNGVSTVSVDSAPSGLIEDAPSNDDLADATDLGSAAPVHQEDDNYFGSLESGEAAATSVDVDASVWFRWTAPSSKTFLVDTCGTSPVMGLAMAVYTATGSLLTDLSSVADNTAGCDESIGGAKTSFAATAGVTYWIEVGSLPGGTQGQFALDITEAPAPPGGGGGGGGGTTSPPTPTNPLTLTVKKALGTLKPKKGVYTLKGAVVACGASATGACTGKVVLTTKQGKKTKKLATGKISVAPGRSQTLTIKLSSSALKAIKKAKSLKATVTVTASGPGFASSTASGSATLKP